MPLKSRCGCDVMGASKHFSHQVVWETAVAAWRSTRLFAMALLAVAVILGAHYRFHRLDRWDLSNDEGTAWAGAVAPSVEAVIAAEPKIENGGKLPPYDVVLHGWIVMFGDAVTSMRRLSAVIGTIVVVLVFIAVREVCRSLGEESPDATGELAGAFAALIYATNLTMVVSDRTAREFPLLLAAELLQVFFFVRAQRCGAAINYAGAAISTAAMIATNYSSSFLLFAEALWLGCLLIVRWTGARVGGLAIVRPGLAVTAGVGLLAPMLPAMFADSERAVQTGAVDWIKVQPISWPFTVLRDSANTASLFWILAALCVFGVWRRWGSARLAVGFLAIWMAGPLLAVFAVTYLIRPMEFPRYVLIAFVGLFAFAGFGAEALRSVVLRLALAVLLIGLSVPEIHSTLRSYHELGWRQAASFAERRTAKSERIAVYNRYKVNVVRYYVVRYYMTPDRRADAFGMGKNDCDGARLLIIRAEGPLSAQSLPAAHTCFPRVLTLVRGVEVRTR
jgi:mannosyltransferase